MPHHYGRGSRSAFPPGFVSIKALQMNTLHGMRDVCLRLLELQMDVDAPSGPLRRTALMVAIEVGHAQGPTSNKHLWERVASELSTPSSGRSLDDECPYHSSI